jgi:Glycosyltransferase family 87
MAHIWQGLRSGEWLTAARARAYALILLATCGLAIIGWLAVSRGLIDPNGKPIGTDFSNVYAAGELTWQGKPADAYDPALQHAAEKATFGGREVPFYGWHYPPFFFAIAFLVASLPYALGLALWLAASFAAYLAAIRAILPRPETLLIAAAFPAVFVNIGHGQNGFLTAALLGGALLLLDRRPWLAGVMIGLLAYKPQFGVMIPIALLASQRWNSIATAIATIAALVGLSFVALGGDVWHAFIDSMNFTQVVVLEQGGTGWEKIQSAFSAARNWGADVHTAYAIQIAFSAMLAATLAWLWHSDAEGVGACDRKPARDALRARLRSRRARDFHRLPRPPRFCTRLPRLRDQCACRSLDHAAALARDCRRHRNPARPDRDARALWPYLAPSDRRSHERAACRVPHRASVI